MNTSTTKQEYDPHGKDVAPGDDKMEHGSVAEGIRTYLIGLAFAGTLTAASFMLVGSDILYGPGIPVALMVLAVAQMGVHLVFFLHITSGPDNTNNVMALAFGVLIVLLIIVGSLWIMSSLHSNMQPTDPLQQMMQAPF